MNSSYLCLRTSWVVKTAVGSPSLWKHAQDLADSGGACTSGCFALGLLSLRVFAFSWHAGAHIRLCFSSRPFANRQAQTCLSLSFTGTWTCSDYHYWWCDLQHRTGWTLATAPLHFTPAATTVSATVLPDLRPSHYAVCQLRCCLHVDFATATLTGFALLSWTCWLCGCHHFETAQDYFFLLFLFFLTQVNPRCNFPVPHKPVNISFLCI